MVAFSPSMFHLVPTSAVSERRAACAAPYLIERRFPGGIHAAFTKKSGRCYNGPSEWLARRAGA
jgi:hypothetical protein